MVFSVEPGVFLLGAVLVVTLPLRWLLCAVFAAAFHELCHLIAAAVLGGRISRMHVGIAGARIEADLSSRAGALTAVLAGPAGSLLLVALAPRLPEAAVCGLFQGICNLLPVRPLDGGRAMKILLDRLLPEASETGMQIVETGVLGLLFLGAVAAAKGLSLGWWPVLGMIVLLSGRLPRKIPCKHGQFRVQ